MGAPGEKLIAFGFPVNAPGARLRAWGKARVQASTELAPDGERAVGMAVAAVVGREIATAAARRSGYEEAVARAEEALRAHAPQPGVVVIALDSFTLAGDDGRELFARPPAAELRPRS